MTRATRSAFAFLAALALLFLVAGPARAQGEGARGGPVYVLTISTDDADDQAEALTQALRSRVRQLRAWSLLEATQSFDTLAIALKCPPRPDVACLTRIGDQLRADHIVWGTMSKKGGGQVGVDLHLWSRGKGDAIASETYSDNLKDASEESLRAIAAKLFAAVSGTPTGGTVVVHAGAGRGDILVDGAKVGVFEDGLGRVEVAAGAHQIAVRIGTNEAPEQRLTVTPGVEQEVNFAPLVAAGSTSDSSKSGISTRRLVAYGAFIAGGAMLVVSAVEAAQWISDSNSSNTDRQTVPKSVTDVCANEISPAALDACRKGQDATTVSTIGWVLGSIGAVLVGSGTVLVLTEHSAGEEGNRAASATPPRPAKPAVNVVPAIGPKGGSLGLRVTF